MKITPLDIQQAGFKVRVRGYDRQEVDSFLDAITEDYEALVRENSTLREKVAESENQLAELRKKEATLNNTLMKAQDLVEEMKHGAQRDADLVLKEAELKAEQMIHGAHEEMAAIRREILDLQKQRVVFLEKIRSMIKIFQRVVELEDREEDKNGKKERSEEERDDNVRLLKPKT
ncbi:MAG TPA: DivIVA domain-containing protein [Nitrospiria bacterium]|jgi:cell division initiation protein|nr:DivIVA domain-containing protein [Nitrospiria bacterium]